MNQERRWPPVCTGCAGGSSAGSHGTDAPSPGATPAGRPTRWWSPRSCCSGPLPPPSRKPTPASLARYPSWDILAHAPLEDLEAALRPLGLWRQKAPAFQQLARSIEARGGVLPRTRQELERLPGIGPYTANAVLALVYGRAEPLLDANMARLLRRFLGSSECVGASPGRTLNALALRLVRGRRSLAVNWAALDFGALVCRPRSPRCPECPLRTRCVYARSLQPRATSTSGVL